MTTFYGNLDSLNERNRKSSRPRTIALNMNFFSNSGSSARHFNRALFFNSFRKDLSHMTIIDRSRKPGNQDFRNIFELRNRSDLSDSLAGCSFQNYSNLRKPHF